jgi:hypothetical protein
MSSAPRAARVARRAYLLLARRREAAIRVSLAFASSAPVGADAVSSELFAPGLGPLVLLIEPAPMARLCSRVRARVRQPQVLARVQLTDGLSSDQSSSRDGAGGLFRV